ncbi:MAG: hypothetical protein WC477_07175 [Patescibacteria group bacterium]
MKKAITQERDDYGVSDLRPAGYEGMLESVIEQAVVDLKGLRTTGITERRRWPFKIYRCVDCHGKILVQKKYKKVLNWYDNFTKVNELEYFLKSKVLGDVMTTAGLKIDHQAMIEALML